MLSLFFGPLSWIINLTWSLEIFCAKENNKIKYRIDKEKEKKTTMIIGVSIVYCRDLKFVYFIWNQVMQWKACILSGSNGL